jgi:hypothetical protein
VFRLHTGLEPERVELDFGVQLLDPREELGGDLGELGSQKGRVEQAMNELPCGRVEQAARRPEVSLGHVSESRQVEEADRVIEVEVSEDDAQPFDAVEELGLGDESPQACTRVEQERMPVLAQEDT